MYLNSQGAAGGRFTMASVLSDHQAPTVIEIPPSKPLIFFCWWRYGSDALSASTYSHRRFLGCARIRSDSLGSARIRSGSASYKWGGISKKKNINELSRSTGTRQLIHFADFGGKGQVKERSNEEDARVTTLASAVAPRHRMATWETRGCAANAHYLHSCWNCPLE